MTPSENIFWVFQFRDLLNSLILMATIAAMIVGPLWALKITRESDERRDITRRKFEIFQSLMKTRRFNLAPEHVMALNLIQVEFYKEQRIDAAYKAYISMLSRAVPKPDDPGAQRFFEEQDDGLYDLLHEIGENLGYKYDKRDLRKLAYGPVGWETEETMGRAIRHMAVELLQGKRALPTIDAAKLNTSLETAPTNGKWPPAPAIPKPM